MCLFWVVTTHPGLPPPSINWQPHSSTIPWPCAIAFHAIPSTSTQGNLDVKLLHACACLIWAAPSTWATTAQPAPWLLTNLSQSISIDNLCIHGWGAVKNPFCLGCSTPHWFFLSIFIDLLFNHGWGAVIIPFCGGPMLHALHVCPIPTTFLPAYAGILFTHG